MCLERGESGSMSHAEVWNVPNDKSNVGHEFQFQTAMQRSGGDNTVQVDRRSIIVMEVHN